MLPDFVFGRPRYLTTIVFKLASLHPGDYVIVDPIEEGEKVKAEISVILYKDHIQHLQRLQLW